MQLVDAVEANEIDAFILNTAYMDILVDMEGYQDVNDRVRSIAEYEVEHKTQVVEQPAQEEDKDSDVFTVIRILTSLLDFVDTGPFVSIPLTYTVNVSESLSSSCTGCSATCVLCSTSYSAIDLTLSLTS